MKYPMVALALACAVVHPLAVNAASVSVQEAAQIAEDAYVFGYPLVIMDTTRAVGTATPKPLGVKAPVNQFIHVREFPDPKFTYVVAPNADTLYSAAWLDLRNEPIVLSVPDTGKRYYLMPMLDAWTNVFASPGSRTTGNGKGNFAIVGPGWHGKLPDDVKPLQAPTNMVWIIGRTQTNGKDDYAAVHAIQEQYRLTPLSAWGKPYTPPAEVPVSATADTKTAPVAQLANMDAVTFFSRLNALMIDNPPAANDAEALRNFARIGVAPGKAFDMKAFDPAVAQAIETGARAGLDRIRSAATTPGAKVVNHWVDLSLDKLGRFGTDYALRASIAATGLGANLREDAGYYRLNEDTDGKPLTGANRYVLHFPKGQTPPVNAFWSVTMYNSKRFFIDNPINRYAIGDRDKLAVNADGSVDIYLQSDQPAASRVSNWLPTPADSFVVSMRLYWPKQAAIENGWTPPLVRRAD